MSKFTLTAVALCLTAGAAFAQSSGGQFAVSLPGEAWTTTVTDGNGITEQVATAFAADGSYTEFIGLPQYGQVVQIHGSYRMMPSSATSATLTVQPTEWQPRQICAPTGCRPLSFPSASLEIRAVDQNTLQTKLGVSRRMPIASVQQMLQTAKAQPAQGAPGEAAAWARLRAAAAQRKVLAAGVDARMAAQEQELAAPRMPVSPQDDPVQQSMHQILNGTTTTTGGYEVPIGPNGNYYWRDRQGNLANTSGPIAPGPSYQYQSLGQGQ